MDVDINNLRTHEGWEVKLYFEKKICTLKNNYDDYQHLYNAIEKLPLFSEKNIKIERLEKEKKELNIKINILKIKNSILKIEKKI
tara:strand:- start:208 stop:462 length:255 start_codon:yes stop_codon:yes gene_type:complete